MADPGHHVLTSLRGRRFAAHAAASLMLIFRDDEHLLLLRRPAGSPKASGWQVVGGAIDAGETLVQGALREAAEELGPSVRVRPLGVAHAWTFHFDDAVPQMVSVAWVMAYEGGDIVPGDDMAGSEWAWFEPGEVVDLGIVIPEGSAWLIERALNLYRTYLDRPLAP